jgi:hypothetical protein
MFALFNSEKKFIGFSPDILDNDKVLKIRIPDEQSDIRLWRWEGDYDTGKMVYCDVGYPIEEEELEKKLFDYIANKYPISIQLINIIRQLTKIAKNDPNIQDYEFMDMSDCILNAIDKQIKRINYYRNYEKLVFKNEKN